MMLDSHIIHIAIKEESRMKKLFYRGIHQYSFRSGEWAAVIGTVFKERLCFLIQFADCTIYYSPVIDIENKI